MNSVEQVETYPLADAINRIFSGPDMDRCVRYEGQWHSLAQVKALAGQINQLLDAASVHPNQAIGLVLRNLPSGYAALAGLVGARRTVVLISPFQEASAIAADVARLDLAAVVAMADNWTAELVQAAGSKGSAGISIDEQAWRATPVSGLEACDGRPGHLSTPKIAVHMLTSGTTGVPKRIPLSRVALSHAIPHQEELAVAMGEAPASAGMSATLLQYAPMVQLSGLFTALQAASEGKPLVMMDKFDARICLETLREFRLGMLGLPPAMLRMLMEANPTREDLSSVKSVRSGAAPLDDQTRDTFELKYGIPILSIYGATEYAGPIAGWTLDDHAKFGAAKRGSVGRLWPEVSTARIVDAETGEDLGRGREGLLEVMVRRCGPEWMRTTDLATIDEDGFLMIHGRADDAIIRGGFKIPPNVIGDALRTHPAVYDATAIGIADERLGQVPVAVVELRKGADPVDEAALLDYARQKLIRYQVPVKIMIVPELPRTPAQKIDRTRVKTLIEGS